MKAILVVEDVAKRMDLDKPEKAKVFVASKVHQMHTQDVKKINRSNPLV
ncbi:MAG: hypothetical protein OEX77_04500 [Candidatus Bathyarchaeota archaeon]|nr:hypothetical protein [Candidatus Bathyarchaeota archaeon]MDH5733034.1 hypothetical protein [Candidatus Bathyarchaeota archaeon]